jgi:hypothetical protein
MLNFNYLCGIVKKYPWSLSGRIKEVFKILEGRSLEVQSSWDKTFTFSTLRAHINFSSALKDLIFGIRKVKFWGEKQNQNDRLNFKLMHDIIRFITKYHLEDISDDCLDEINKSDDYQCFKLLEESIWLLAYTTNLCLTSQMFYQVRVNLIMKPNYDESHAQMLKQWEYKMYMYKPENMSKVQLTHQRKPPTGKIFLTPTKEAFTVTLEQKINEWKIRMNHAPTYQQKKLNDAKEVANKNWELAFNWWKQQFDNYYTTRAELLKNKSQDQILDNSGITEAIQFFVNKSINEFHSHMPKVDPPQEILYGIKIPNIPFVEPRLNFKYTEMSQRISNSSN